MGYSRLSEGKLSQNVWKRLHKVETSQKLEGAFVIFDFIV